MADVAHVGTGLLPLKSRRNPSSGQRRCNSPLHDGTASVHFSGHSSLVKGKAVQGRIFHSKLSKWGQDLMVPPSPCGTLSCVPTSSPSTLHSGGITRVVLDSSQHRPIAAGARPSRFVCQRGIMSLPHTSSGLGATRMPPSGGKLSLGPTLRMLTGLLRVYGLILRLGLYKWTQRV